MLKRFMNPILLLSASLAFFGCAGEKMELVVKATMDGKPAEQAVVTVDGDQVGTTDATGVLTKILRKKPGAEVRVVVSKEQAGYRITPWSTTVLMKLPKEGMVDRYALEARLEALRYVTLVVAEQGAPIMSAVVQAGGKEVGATDAQGLFVYEYKTLPATGADLSVRKSGYAVARKRGPLVPGERIAIELAKQARLTVMALADEHGMASGIPGVAVSVDKRSIGRTDSKGVATYAYDGEPGKKVEVALQAPGHFPASWKTTVTLEGEPTVKRYFYPLEPRPIRTALYRFGGNTPNVDLKELLSQAESALGAQLFKYDAFQEVSTKTLLAELKQAKQSIEKATAKGWRDTQLMQSVDLIVLGSIAQEEKGYVMEVKCYSSGGSLVVSRLARFRGERELMSAAKEIAAAVVERFPFEGMIIAKDDDRYRLNLGKSGYKITKGTEFALLTPRMDETGRITGYRESGRIKARKVEDGSSWTEVEDIKKGERIAIGSRAVRRVFLDHETERTVGIILAKGGIAPDVAPLSGVNLYLNEEWIGSTGRDGKAEVPLRVGKKYDLVLYKHGYQQAADRFRIEKNREVKEFTLQVNNSVFKVDSEPRDADVFVDGEKIGRTPLLDGKLVNLGFHTVRVTVGGDYRDWEEVVDFDKKTEDRTGTRKIVLMKDYLKIGERAERKGDLDGAIAAYGSTEKGHPDYSETRHRMAQIYLDEKNDYDAAIREFENVLSLPENQQLVYKQFSVAFTNLGHAYYAKGNELTPSNREAAAQNFAKAIQNLQVAKQNTRFFPTVHYDEALHDTYYYTALSYHKLYLITKKGAVLNNANLAWREYFDFFPKGLENKAAFEQTRDSARKYWDQIKGLM